MALSRSRAMRFLQAGLLLFSTACTVTSPSPQQSIRPKADQQIDQFDFDEKLAHTAKTALGEREGAVLVINPQTGRLRAVVNPRLAFEQAFPPGSTIKPFTALAALRAGILERDTHRPCQGRFVHDDFTIVCSHPRSRTPFDLPHALGYSCNYYFACVGERLSESAFHATLTAFGFGARTGVNASSEIQGRLPQGESRLQTLLGESDNLLVTPIQLLMAYTALANDGKLFRPQHIRQAEYEPMIISTLRLAPSHRAVLIEGMRGAVSYGTATEADLDSLPLYIFGKTGTSTSSNGFRTQGWFVGFAADQPVEKEIAPESVRLGVLVFLKRAHGSEGARIAQSIFEAFSGTKALARDVTQDQIIKVHLVSEGRTLSLTLDEYLTGVIAAEASVENELEALKALAVVSRTYTLKNLKRHAADGYDLCSTTHCQRFVSGSDIELAKRAVRETTGEIISDERGYPIEAYFHAACGGATTDPKAVWGVSSPSNLRGMRDDYCIGTANNRWVDRISTRNLLSALRRDQRSDVGARLNDVVIIQRDASGRAEWIALEGERRRIVRGWDFKLIVGRALGWNLIKSSRFEVMRSGDDFIFRGNGFGHGLGLCQEGAHVMARRGAGYRRILSHYFRDVSIQHEGFVAYKVASINTESVPKPLFAGLSLQNRRSLSSEHFRINFTSGVEPREIERALQILESARNEMLHRLSLAGLTLAEPRALEVIVSATTVDFINETGQPGWSAGATKGGRIALQPLSLLKQRGILDHTLRHEYAHVVIDALSEGRIPRWLAEGIAAHFAGEGSLLAQVKIKEQLTNEELERRLVRPTSAIEMRTLYAAAYRAVHKLILAEGEALIWRRIAGRHTL